jgi:hypothetical protein
VKRTSNGTAKQAMSSVIILYKVFYEQKDVSLYEKWEQSSPGKSLRKLS